MKQNNILSDFSVLAHQKPKSIAFSIGDREYSYEELLVEVQLIAGWLQEKMPTAGQRVGILCSRNFFGYASIFSVIWAGLTFVPLNPKLPIARLNIMMQRAKISVLITDDTCSEIMNEISLEVNKLPILTLCDDSLKLKVDKTFSLLEPINVDETKGAYLMFTSGTTGEPKGILATVGNLKHYLNFMQDRYQIQASDRLSQVFEFSFDASTFDMFMSINHGASFHVVPDNQLLAPGQFIRDKKLTLWFGVPSHISFMEKMNLLKPASFSNLRISIFGGEPLSVSSMKAWRLAADKSILDNVYGPTEATVTCFVQRCNDSTPITSERNVMSIGMPYEGMYGAIIDDAETFLPSGTKGELLIAGPQVTSGYWQNSKLTESRFRVLDHPVLGKHCWYFTGDWAYEDDNGVFHHLGRMDNQIKLSGHRVELEEIDVALKKAAESEIVASIAWPVEQGSARGIVAFICGSKVDVVDIREKMLDVLPKYMIPRRFIVCESLPYTLNGKVDRKLLAEKLEN